MSYKKGIVEFVSIEETQSGTYGNYAKGALKVDGKYYSILAGEDKATKQCVIKDTEHRIIEKGDEVEFMFKSNDKGYHQIDKKTLKTLSVQKTTPPAQPAPVNPDPVKPEQAQYEKEFKSGALWVQCLNAAVATAPKIIVRVGEGEDMVEKAINFSSEQIVRVANRYFESMP